MIHLKLPRYIKDKEKVRDEPNENGFINNDGIWKFNLRDNMAQGKLVNLDLFHPTLVSLSSFACYNHKHFVLLICNFIRIHPHIYTNR